MSAKTSAERAKASSAGVAPLSAPYAPTRSRRWVSF
jgi:hypothetical protein